jgi:hypothetical protein
MEFGFILIMRAISGTFPYRPLAIGILQTQREKFFPRSSYVHFVPYSLPRMLAYLQTHFMKRIPSIRAERVSLKDTQCVCLEMM